MTNEQILAIYWRGDAEVRQRLEDILEHSDRMARLVAKGKKRFLSNEHYRGSAERSITVIGEAAGKIPAEVRASFHDVDWRTTILDRNLTVHEYGSVVDERTWATISQAIPAFVESIGLHLIASPASESHRSETGSETGSETNSETNSDRD